MINLVQIKPEGRDGTTWYNILPAKLYCWSLC